LPDPCDEFPRFLEDLGRSHFPSFLPFSAFGITIGGTEVMAIAFLINYFYSGAIGTAITRLKLSGKSLKKS
jgi:hypothetical protein